MNVLLLTDCHDARNSQWQGWLTGMGATVVGPQGGTLSAPADAKARVGLIVIGPGVTLPEALLPACDADIVALLLGEAAGPPGIRISRLSETVTEAAFQRRCRSLLARSKDRQRIRQLKRRCRRLQRLALLDHLTRLPNRRAWERHLRRALKHPATQTLALAVLDLDSFHEINAQYGHAAGDAVLQAAAQALQAEAPLAFVARLGGDEFGLLWTAPAVEELEPSLMRWRQALHTHALETTGKSVTVSLGCSLAMPADHAALEMMFDRADAALLRCKAAGRNRHEVDVA